MSRGPGSGDAYRAERLDVDASGGGKFFESSQAFKAWRRFRRRLRRLLCAPSPRALGTR
jgi:hypothetical protein